MADDAISGDKLASGFTEYVKLMVGKHFSNGIKIVVFILVTGSYDGVYQSITYKERANEVSLKI